MKILFAVDKNDINPYIFEITENLKYPDIEYYISIDLFWKSDIYFDIIHIHWPEALFHWKRISLNDLRNFKKRFLELSKISKLIFTYHDEKSHFNDTKEVNELFKFILENSNAIIHLGEKSYIKVLNDFSLKLPKQNEIILHPFYRSYPNSSNFESARKELEIPLDRFVVLVFGEMRSREETKFVLKVLRKTRINKLTLLTGKWKPHLNYIHFGNRLFQKIQIKYYWIFKKYRINFNYIKKERVHLYFNASNIVFVPRLRNLNSGVVYLGLTFRKVVVGPKTGNIEEILNFFGFPSFKVNNISDAANAILLAKKMSYENKYFDEYDKKRIMFDPRKIGHEHIKLYNKLLIN